ncbi:hypothetical protein [Bosea sp. RAC05]|uniref:hypothetical protein n=1 Tax=Bosea sp. RAC05 TaxID=1842539 RepID=UPI0008557743|nr:hypothetical protein [Bosea sp. RAC05]AOG04380.1 hypothetical protein BSY19_797 [Bosea sp. RAC05]
MPSGPAKRDDLIACVIAGTLSPAEAEAEAARLGLRAIEYRPDPNDFDPMQEQFWTLPMAVAWVAYRTAETVRENWDKYRLECVHWLYSDQLKAPGRSGFDLFHFAPANLRRLKMAEKLEEVRDLDPDYLMPVSNAIDALWQALRGSCFEASGIERESGKREIIDALRLQDLVFGEDEHRDVMRQRAPIGIGPVRYTDITVPMGGVRGHWGVRPLATRQAKLPDLMRPDGLGVMPLYCAAQWIATEGGTIDFDPTDLDRWRAAYGELLARISSDEMKVIGFRDGMREPVPGYQFAGVKVSYPFADTPIALVLSDEMYLQSYAYTCEKDWLEGLDDSLLKHRGPKWARLVLLRADVAKLWPFAQAGGDLPDPYPLTYRSGGPGRPSSMHLVEAEFRRRCALATVEVSMAKESVYLAAWLRSAHPTAPPLTPKTIQNRLLSAFRAHAASGK